MDGSGFLHREGTESAAPRNDRIHGGLSGDDLPLCQEEGFVRINALAEALNVRAVLRL